MNSALRDNLVGLPIYRPTRFAYQWLFDRPAIVRRRRRSAFYSTFIRNGDLVFDVGANLGNYTEALCSAGATVVAIEPDPRNLRVLRRRAKGLSVHIEQCAMGSKESTAELHVASDRDDVSTLSDRWADNTQARWEGVVQVQVRTLDSIATRYGIPRYLKVDAEGYDAEVLRGMSFRPQVVSFEFLSVDLGIARECISLLQEWSFNLVFEEESRFELAQWVSAAEILSMLSAPPQGVRYGDVFAKPAGT